MEVPYRKLEWRRPWPLGLSLRALAILPVVSAFSVAQPATGTLSPSGPGDAAPAVVQVRNDPPDYRLEFLPKVHLSGQRRLVLALGGGAAKGIAHAGVLQRLQEEGITVDAIAGTSMGAFIGSMYAAGYSGQALEALLEDVDLGSLLLDRQHRIPGETLWEQERENTTFLSLEYRRGSGFAFTPGASPGLELKRALEILLSRTRLHAHRDFDGLRMPFRAVSTNLQTGRADAPRQGDLAAVVRASMSIPGMFSPVLLDGQQHLDGMLVQNLPVETARGMEPQAVVAAVEVGESLESMPQQSIFGIALRSLDVSIEERTSVSRRSADLLIRPDTASIPHLDFHSQVPAAVARGREAFNAHREALESLLYGPAARWPAPIALRIEAPEPLRSRLEALAAANLPEGPRDRGEYLRLLRLASGKGLVRAGELRFGPEAVVLAAEPYAVVLGVQVQAPEPWAARIEGLLSEAGVRVGDPFNPVALGQALDRLFYRLTIEGRPLVSAEGTVFDPDTGLLQVKVTERVPRTVRVANGILPPAETDYLNHVFRQFQGQPYEIWPFARQQLMAEKRLGLEELQPGPDPAAPKDGVLLTPLPDQRTIIDAAFAYETTWQAQTALQVRTHHLLGTGLGLRLDASVDKVWQSVGVVLTRPLAFWPRLSGEASLRQQEHHFQQPFLPQPAQAGLPPDLSSRSLRERSLGLGLSARVGLEDRGLLTLEASRGQAVLQPADQTGGLPRMDQMEVRFELDEFDRYLFPTSGTLVRFRYGGGRLAAPDTGGSRTYRFGYGRFRHLLPLGDWGSLETDLEGGTGSHSPLPRWHPVGGPAFLSGSPSVGQPVANFAMGRLGLPLQVLGAFGVHMQLVPRIDAGYLGADDPSHLRQGAWVRGIGLGLRSELGRWYCELSGGRWSSDAGGAERVRLNVLLGAHPFDLWHPRP